MVRARAEKDLENLVKNVKSLEDRQIIVTKDADYHFRIIISQSELNSLMMYFSETIDYSNFKNKINSIPDQRDKLLFYHEIWETMYRYQKYLK
jgi:hypothetical protein